MKEAGLIDLLETAIKNSVVELAIEQWLHSLYLLPGLDWRSDTKEYQIAENLKVFLNLKIAPPSISQKIVSHKIQSMDYFKEFVPAIMKSINKEFSAFFKNKDSINCVYYFEDTENIREEFCNPEAIAKFLKEDYAFDEFGRSFSRSASMDNSLIEDEAQEKQSLYMSNMTPTQTLVDVLKERQQTNPSVYQIKEDSCMASNSNLKPSKSPLKGPKKFNHYSFDVTKGSAPKRDTFNLAMRLKSPPISDSTPLDQYGKVNAHQSEPKTLYCDTSDEKKMQFPVRRFLVCLEVSTNDVRLLTYNVKSDIVAKLYESLAEEILYQEMRETLILGLTSAKIMNSIYKNQDANDFERRLCERYEKTRVESHKKLNEHQIGLKLTWDYRFGDKDKSKNMAKSDNTTITERVYEMLKGESNSLLLQDHRISFDERHKIKQLMDAICSTIKVMFRKMKSESLEVNFMPEPELLDGCWFGDQASLGASVSRGSKIANESQFEDKQTNKSSIYLGIPKISDDMTSNKSSSSYSKKYRPISSTNSPLLKTIKHHSTFTDRNWNIDVPLMGKIKTELDSPAESSNARRIQKSQSNEFLQADSDQENSQEGDVQNVERMHSKTGIDFNMYVERSLLNMNLLQRNFSEHLFDARVKQIFTIDESQRMDLFMSFKNQRKILII